MSDKDRQKKDGKRTDKKNKAMRDRANQVAQEASPRQQARDVSNLTDTAAGPERDRPERTGGRRG